MSGMLRLGDPHLCKMLEGNVPHIGGPAGVPVPPAVTTVFVNGRPAITKGDAAFCVGRPDKVVAGIDSVLIGGRPAADASAATDHGGKFVASSTDVLIG
jgi:uncharacterized Zn-binding protein involved in type VI secretion